MEHKSFNSFRTHSDTVPAAESVASGDRLDAAAESVASGDRLDAAAESVASGDRLDASSQKTARENSTSTTAEENRAHEFVKIGVAASQLRLTPNWTMHFLRSHSAALLCELRNGKPHVRPIDLYRYIVEQGNGVILPQNPTKLPPPPQPPKKSEPLESVSTLELFRRENTRRVEASA